MKNKLSTIILVLVLLTGLSLILYPSVSDYWNSLHATQAVADYTKIVEDLDTEDYEALWAAATAYNEALAATGIGYELSDEQRKEYESLLDVSGTGVMGYIDIPCIDVTLPIYHGTEDTVLQIAVGHIEWSSLPVGGKSTHCVLSGHRGLPSARLFTNLDEMREGDTFTVHVLDEVLTYEVDQIRIVLPEELEDLQIEEGKDLCTLVTCTPYGVNSHRLLVRGHRIENEAEEAVVTSDALQVKPVLVASIAAAPILLLLLIVVLLTPTRKKR